MESKLMRGDPDGTRKRPAHFCVNSLSSCVVADQRLTDADRRRTARESTRLDRKLDTAWKWFLTACAIAPLWGAANLARAEAYIKFDPMVAGTKTFSSVALNVNDSVMFSAIDGGGVFYTENGKSYANEVWGSCMQIGGVYQCTFTTGEYTLKFQLNKATRKGVIWPLDGPFDSKDTRKAEWTDLAPRLQSR